MNWLITGGSRGLGANLVEEVAKDGHTVVFTYNNNEEKAREVAERARAASSAAQVRFCRLDVKDVEQVEAVVDQVIEELDSIEVLVNNAAVTRDNIVVSMLDEEWDEVIATNLTGPFYLCRQVLPVMLANRFGRIINISSIAAFGASGQANYAAAKSGLHGLTKAITKEYGRRGITANVVLPAYFETDMTRQGVPEVVRNFWKQHSKIPKGRSGEPREFSAAVKFLASRDASFVNGQLLEVSTGMNWIP